MASQDMFDPTTYTKQLYEQAGAFEVDSSIPVKRYYRSGTEMERQARMYDKDGNKEKAYVLYTKFCILFLEKVKSHPNISDVPATDRARVRKLLRTTLPRAEELKKELTEIQQKKIDNYRQKLQAEEERKKKKEEEMKAMETLKSQESSETVALFLSGIGGETVENAMQEQTGNKPSIVPSLNNPQTYGEDDDDDDTIEAWLTPSAPPMPVDTSNTPPPPFPDDIGPPIATINEGIPIAERYPVIPQDELTITGLMATPLVDRSTKPSLSSLSTDIDWAGEGLRTVIVPADVPREFLMRASSNTRRNVETCGILAGNLSQGCLKLTHIIIPKQTGTSDSCDTCNEEEIFEALDSNDLITLGWIHTHPSQSSFMSSIDLHTQCSYQLMLPEAISIVVAPKFDEVGYFTLTTPFGLEQISKCRQQGFHPHFKEPPIYEESSHVKKDPSYAVIIVDLRK